MRTMDKVSGAECPGCGCEDSRLVKSTMRWGQTVDQRRCENCGRTFTVALQPAAPRSVTAQSNGSASVIFHVLKCPRCKSDDIKTRSTQRPKRYHRCNTCGEDFVSCEQ